MSPTTKISGCPGTRQRRLGGDAAGAIERHAERLSRAATPRRPPPTARSAPRCARSPGVAATVTPSASTPVTTEPVRTSTPSRSSDVARRVAQRARETCAQDVRAAFEQHDARRLRADAAEVLPQRLPRDLGERAGQLDAGRPAADDDERQQPALRRRGPVSRSAASNASSTRRRISSASSSVFRPGARARPLGMAEVRVRRAGGDDQVVVRHRRVAADRSSTTRAPPGRSPALRPAAPRRSSAGAESSGSATRCRPATATPSPPDRAAAGTGGSCGDRGA